MYKLLLSWRYLRTRYIALASIISVTLGVATLIIVNSVMAGFTEEMENRLNGILSDIIFQAHSHAGAADAEWHMKEIRDVVGEDLAGITAAVHVPGMLYLPTKPGEVRPRQIMVIGVDEETYGDVSDFESYLLHPENREKFSFLLREDGWSDRLPVSGAHYRRIMQSYNDAYQVQAAASAESASGAPVIDADTTPPPDPFGGPQTLPESENAEPYTPPGIVLGIAIGSLRGRDSDGEVSDYFIVRPGDDIQISLSTVGVPPSVATDTFTVVDFYESKMSDYDSNFAFVPLKELQQMRGMFHNGEGAVTTIQLKLTDGADLNAVRDRLLDRFPPHQYAFRIQTWREMQGPLLAAVQLETTILNILLFLIIAVAGFGILATFFMIVVEKTRDIGILKSLGAPSRGVMSIFLSYGLSLGAVGSGVGMVLGLLFVDKINEIAMVLEAVTGREVFPADVYYFMEIPTIVEPITVAGVVVGAVFIAVMASVLPAFRAARLHPVEALRYE
ncbi:MAG: FtsX-like permease family protein [Pirellulaceae bacterium]|jgi:lipoprotein-releasing system permease protein|nr:FtsX-like permease family protein [Pirellulaceae bacterium]MDP7014829.1 FtsX-like permease family protein [Pirellulaceae bacterium]